MKLQHTIELQIPQGIVNTLLTAIEAANGDATGTEFSFSWKEGDNYCDRDKKPYEDEDGYSGPTWHYTIKGRFQTWVITKNWGGNFDVAVLRLDIKEMREMLRPVAVSM